MAKRKKREIPIKTEEEIDKMRVAGQLASEVLQKAAKAVQVGVTTREIDELVADMIAERDATATFFNYRGFPGSICISVTEEVVHGIGGNRKIQPGDLVSIDIGVTKNGWIGDNAVTVPVGPITDESKRLLAATEESLFQAIALARAGEPLANLCGSVEDHVRKHGFTVVRDLVGHGVGSDLHEKPEVPNFRPTGRTPKLQAGMIIAIEPMVNMGKADVEIMEDGWTVLTRDRLPSVHFEHTVAITADGPRVLTRE